MKIDTLIYRAIKRTNYRWMLAAADKKHAYVMFG